MSRQKKTSEDLLRLLQEAWNERNATQFQNCLSENLETAQINEIVHEIVLSAADDEYNSARFTFSKIIFENHLHRKSFQKNKSLIFHLLERGNSKILELLLEYTPNLRKTGDGGNSPLHFLCNRTWLRRKESFQNCMELLLNHPEIDINALNNEYRSPLDLAIACKNLDAIKMLLNSPKKINLDKRYHHRPTAREEIKNFFPDLGKTLPEEDANGRCWTISELHLWLRNEKDENKNKFIERFPEAMQNAGLIDELTNNLNLFLQEACENNLMDEVKLLMNYGADPSVEDKWNDSRSAITVAVENGHIHILALLLERASVINYKLNNSGKNKDNVNFKDEYGNTALHYAVRYGNDKAMLEILKLGGYLGAENNKNENPLTKIPARVLKKFLNNQLKQVKNEPTHTNHTTIPMESRPSQLDVKQFGYNREKFNFDCRFLTRPKKSAKPTNTPTSPDMKLLKQMTEIKELRPLITHPVLRSFTLLKWEKLKKIFFINLIFYAVLNIFLTYNIISVPLTGNEMDVAPRSLQGLLILLLLLQEILQVLIRGMKYIKQYENYLELMIIGMGAYLCIQGITDISIFRHLGACVVVVSWLGFLLFIGKHPLFSIQVEMFRMVFWSFVKFLSVYLILILAFAFAFFVLFNECDDVCPTEFKKVEQSIFKTFVMVSGEFDLSDMPFNNYPGTSHVIFVLFLFLVAIVLLNLLNGLAVYDTKKIKEDALLHSYVSRVRYLASLEELLFGVRHWSFFKKLTDHFLKFDCQIVDSEEKLYELDPDILKVSRGIAIENARDKDLIELEVKQMLDSDKRSESDEKLLRMVMDLHRKMDELDRKLVNCSNLRLSESSFVMKL